MKILLIEDDTFFRQFYSFKLKEKKFEVDEAANGEEGIQKIAQFHPDIVLLDLIMPIKDGFSVLDAVSKDEALKKIPIIVFSTLGQQQDIEKAKKMGAVDYIDKSFFDFDALVQKILSHTKTQ